MSSPEPQVFVVLAQERVGAPVPNVQFLAQASTHRDAWRVAREICRTGQGALVRDALNGQLDPIYIKAGAYTVKRVLATSGAHRGRPPKLTATDLMHLANDRHVRVPKPMKELIAELSAG